MRITTAFLLSLALIGCRGEDDADEDGFDTSVDCNDGDAAVNPDALEVCDGVDNNCDRAIDETDGNSEHAWYADSDADGYGDAGNSVFACAEPTGHVENSDDCDDTSNVFHPGAAEADCTDPADYNCDGSVGYADADGDGHPACEECDDNDASTNPDAAEVPYDGIDNDCDAVTVDDDLDGDGYNSAEDCDDNDIYTSPGAPEIAYDGVDNDCNPETVDDDLDGDSFAAADDCDDDDDTISPSGVESCDGIDNDCDGDIDEAGSAGGQEFYLDSDDDGFGDANNTATDCEAPEGYVDDDTDCNDADGNISPGAAETCNGIDDNCDGATDLGDAVDQATWYLDSDGDGFGATAEQAACDQPTGWADNSDDCNDVDASINPDAAEGCNGLDNNCDGAIDSDADGDGQSDSFCGGTDCDDDDGDVGGDCSCEQIGDATGSGPMCPAESCTTIFDEGLDEGDGVYWIYPHRGDKSDAFQATCDMSNGGWTLMAEYDGSLQLHDWDATRDQLQDDSGGSDASEPPLLDGDTYGHVAFTHFAPTNMELKFECQLAGDAWVTETTAVADGWDVGDYPNYGASRWVTIADADTSRSHHYLCGQQSGDRGWRGIGLCAGGGSGGSWANHRASFSFAEDPSISGGSVSTGCNGQGVNDGTTRQAYGRIWTKRSTPELTGGFDFEDDLEDITGNGNTGLMGGSATFDDGDDGRALYLDNSNPGLAASNAWVQLPWTNVPQTDKMTVAIWVKSNTEGQYYGLWQMVSQYSKFILGNPSTDTNEVSFIVAAPSWHYGPPTAIADPEEWHHFVGTYDSATGTKILYVDGLETARQDVGVGRLMQNDQGPIDLGHRECCDHGGLDGWMDGLRFYDSVLSPAEVEALFNDGAI